MPTPEKVQAVKEIKERLEAAEAAFLTEYRGLSVGEQQELRRALRAAGSEYKIVKMSLARFAARELGLDEFAESLVGPIGIAFSQGDPATTARALHEFAKEHGSLVLKTGLISGALLAPEQVAKLAELEPRDVLLGKIAGAMRAPTANAASLFGALFRNSAYAFSQLLDKKSELPPAEPAAVIEEEAVEEAVEVSEPDSAADERDGAEEDAVEEVAPEASQVPADEEDTVAEDEATEQTSGTADQDEAAVEAEEE